MLSRVHYFHLSSNVREKHCCGQNLTLLFDSFFFTRINICSQSNERINLNAHSSTTVLSVNKFIAVKFIENSTPNSYLQFANNKMQHYVIVIKRGALC